ncbi:unnamed protein product [Cuscuta campestris]|uniref:Uncharacterized protein n=1 Tax=Cuscuta campestris TaxID=132261 RepID=A0A484KH73_9ASTE|nr:unnamed protein product [Cuscuta campestris]
MSSTSSTSFRGSIRGRGSFQRSHSRASPESSSTTTPQSIFNAGGDLEAEVEVEVEGEGEGGGGAEGGDGVSTEASAVPYVDLPRLITKAELKGEQAVLNTIKVIIKESFHGPWNTYTTAPKEVRQRWWNLFRLRYTWLPGAYPAGTEKIMRSAFNTRGSVWLTKRFMNARNKNKKPSFVGEDHWETMVKYWASPDFRAKSVRSSKNRNTEKAKQRQYYGGRRSVSEHIKKMANFNRQDVVVKFVIFANQGDVVC